MCGGAAACRAARFRPLSTEAPTGKQKHRKPDVNLKKKKTCENSGIEIEIVELDRILIQFYSNSILFWNRIGVEIVELLFI